MVNPAEEETPIEETPISILINIAQDCRTNNKGSILA
jgi:hypothetical protein